MCSLMSSAYRHFDQQRLQVTRLQERVLDFESSGVVFLVRLLVMMSLLRHPGRRNRRFFTR